MKKYILVFLVQIFCASFAWAVDLSNRMPVALVEELMQQGLWSEQFELNNNPQGEEIFQFWTALVDKNQSHKVIAEKFFSGQKDFHDRTSIYQIKVTVLRWMKLNDKVNTGRWQLVERALLEKYLQMTISLIKLSSIQEFETILLTTRQEVEAGRLQLIDLSPSARENLSKQTNNLHPHLSRLVLQKHEGNYAVNALLQLSTGVLAIDLKRSVAENVVTISHEIVHVGDPELRANKQKLEVLYPKLIAKLQALIPSKNSKLDITESLVMDVYHELGRQDALSVVQKMREKRLEAIKTEYQNDANFSELLRDPDLKDWSESLIKVTLENEVKAYILSLVLYRQLYQNLNLIPFSFEREKFISGLQGDNFNFALSVSAAVNPFNRQTFLSKQVGEDVKDIELMRAINQVKALLETHYLTATKVFLQSIQTKYAALLKILNQLPVRSNEEGSILPEWTQPGKFDSPLNPYTVLTAKISTAWVLRFKQGARSLIETLQGMNESLLTLKAGILDLHDLNFGELQMLGLHSANSNAQYLPRELQGNVRNDLSSQPEFLVKYFKDSQWVPTDFTDRPVVDQQSLASNLIRLRLLKALYWLDTGFVSSQEHLTAIKTFRLKLREGLYDKDELDPERVVELETELDKAMNIASASGYELGDFGILMESLVSYYEIAREEKWIAVANEFSRKLTSAKLFLTNLGLDSILTDQAHKEKIGLEVNTLKNQIDKHFEYCKAQKEMLFIPGGQKFTIRQASFPVTAICYNEELYLFRQPGDFTRSATTLIREGRPESRIFIGSRPIRLSPFLNYKNRGIKWFWQNN